MKLLFSIEEDGDVVLQDNTFLLIPELRQVHEELGGKFIRFIVLSCDYHSPYRELTHKEKVKEICLDLWEKTPDKVKKLDDPLMALAITKYKSLQYDPIIEQYKVYTEKLKEYNEFIADASITKGNDEELIRVMLLQEKLTESRERLGEKIVRKQEEEKLRGGGEVSLLEEMLEG